MIRHTIDDGTDDLRDGKNVSYRDSPLLFDSHSHLLRSPGESAGIDSKLTW